MKRLFVQVLPMEVVPNSSQKLSLPDRPSLPPSGLKVLPLHWARGEWGPFWEKSMMRTGEAVADQGPEGSPRTPRAESRGRGRQEQGRGPGGLLAGRSGFEEGGGRGAGAVPILHLWGASPDGAWKDPSLLASINSTDPKQRRARRGLTTLSFAGCWAPV